MIYSPPRANAAWLFSILLWMHGSAARGQVPDTLRHSLYAPETLPQQIEKQGFDVALDGTYAVVGAPNYDSDDVALFDCGVVKVFECDTGKLLHVLRSPCECAFSYFGHAVAISGSRVVVGEASMSGSVEYAGRVHVYDLDSPEPTVPIVSLENPDPVAHDLFGNAVAIDGDRVVVGEWQDDAGAPNAGMVHVFDLSSPTSGVPEFSLQNPSPAADDNFGSAVALSGARLVVSAFRDDTVEVDAGQVYVYDLDSANPLIPVETLSRVGAEENDCFGNALSLSGAHLAVGIEAADVGAVNAGSVAVYDLSSANPDVPIATLVNPVVSASDYFGTSVSIDGNFVVVGEYRDGSSAVGAGACHVYDLAGGSAVTAVSTLTKAVPQEGDYFGNSVSISGRIVVVGAWFDDLGDEDAGASYVFDFDAPNPDLPVAVLGNPVEDSADQFGAAVAITGDIVVVGSPESNSGASGSGEVSIHDLADPSPTVAMATLINPTPKVDDHFGNAVSASGSLVVVAAVDDDLGAIDSGCVHVFDTANEGDVGWVATIPNPTPAVGDGFGNAIAVSGDRLVVGVSGYDSGGSNSGRAYVFDLSSPTSEDPVAILENPTPGAEDRFGHSVAISGDLVVVSSAMDDGGAVNAGVAYVYDLSGPSPAVPLHTFLNPLPEVDDFFGDSVSISGDRVAVGASGDNLAAPSAGTVYVFDLTSPSPTVPINTLIRPSAATGDEFGATVSVSGAWVSVGAKGADGSGRVYSFDLDSTTPETPSAVIQKGTPISGDQFGSAVSMYGLIVVVGVPSDDNTETDKGAAYVYGPAAPEIAVMDEAGVSLPSGGSSDFGPVAMGPGEGATVEFRILNTGITELTIPQVSLVGGDALDFTINDSGLSAAVDAGDDTEFSVLFAPSMSGIRSTTLRIENSDENENPFLIQLTGHGLSPNEDTDGDGLNDVSELKMVGLGFDWQVPDPDLAQIFQTSTVAAGFVSLDQVQTMRLSKASINRNSATGEVVLSWSLEKDDGISGYQPFPLTAPQTTINAGGELEFLFSVPENPAFFLLETE